MTTARAASVLWAGAARVLWARDYAARVRVYVLNSGSSGNVTIVESGGARLAIDAGLNPTVATRKMRELGADLFPRGAIGIVVTHHHGDHAYCLASLARSFRAPVFLHAGIDEHRVRQRFDVREYVPGVPFSIGPFEIDALRVPHDAPQVALRVTADDRSFGMVTDLGHVPRGLATFLGRCDTVLVESNYCPRMLAEGPYPPRLQGRVAGPLGHLSNEDAAELVAELRGMRTTRVLLGHVSRHNNTPARALEVVRARLGERAAIAVEVVRNGSPLAVDVDRSYAPAPFEQIPLLG